jgi:LemA protein
MAVGIIVGIGIVGFLVVVVLWFMVRYNGFVHLKALVDEGWSGIDVQLKRRYDLIPNLISVVKGYAIHEKGVLEEVVRLRSVAMGATQVAEKQAAEAGLSQALKSLFAVVENYPNLKANESFLSLQKELSAIEHELQLSRRYYNGAARNYNVAIMQAPGNIVARLAGFNTVAYFELQENEREVPKVQF